MSDSMRPILCCVVSWGLVALLAGCNSQTQPLQLKDLTPAERRYIERFVILERARAVALVDNQAGPALLDSLAAAWGDSAHQETRANLTNEPTRVAALHDLLLRILDAERDSLIQVPEARRLTAPIPDPSPVPPSP
jgi:hypothetical protein